MPEVSEIGDRIIESLEEALADAWGKPTGLRHPVVRMSDVVDVKSIRGRLGMSQSQFAAPDGTKDHGRDTLVKEGGKAPPPKEGLKRKAPHRDKPGEPFTP